MFSCKNMIKSSALLAALASMTGTGVEGLKLQSGHFPQINRSNLKQMKMGALDLRIVDRFRDGVQDPFFCQPREEYKGSTPLVIFCGTMKNSTTCEQGKSSAERLHGKRFGYCEWTGPREVKVVKGEQPQSGEQFSREDNEEYEETMAFLNSALNDNSRQNDNRTFIGAPMVQHKVNPTFIGPPRMGQKPAIQNEASQDAFLKGMGLLENPMYKVGNPSFIGGRRKLKQTY